MMNVLYTLDTNFFPELVVSLNSLIHYSKQKLNIYIICDDITREMKEKLLKLRSITISIFFLPAPKIPLELKPDRGSKSQFYRLFIGSIFENSDINRIIYLDCDTMITDENVNKLSNIEMDGKTIAATVDPWSPIYKKILNIDENDDIFNSGLFVCDVKKWNKQLIEKKIYRLIANRKHLFQGDQGLLNEVFCGNFKHLNPEYNVISSYFAFDYSELLTFRRTSRFYSKPQILNAIKKPIIIHFTSSFISMRPWNTVSHHPYTKNWRKIAFQNIENFQLNDNKITMTERLYYRFPHWLAIRFISCLQCCMRPMIIKMKIWKAKVRGI
ncbi:glycosyltransferase family 8 protein [Lactiplantibacillus plantarum]|nr:glycosyltransferase family 8 protein [Lactiplantibacillus plantarum]MCG0644216.1 glycosyltransferase family 8 protein [Lactiplantibacillus plantarum]MCG0647314.1 glycosyltransferase family 8 protein [Lactiplantibacillus plantarum]MCG0653529.1 glycosyltransferase family 8 protein [Lactiplantibacillus plantarum]MCG0786421.1 glycosyltransferase family 8 protein [Lactiplantibacillus plantarum]